MKKPVSFNDLVSLSGGRIAAREPENQPEKQAEKRDIYAELLSSIKSNSEAVVALADAIKSRESQAVNITLPQQKKQISLEVTMDRGRSGLAKKYYIKGTA